MADVTYFRLEMEEVTRQRAEAVGMDYDGILNGCGLTSTVWESSKKLYKTHCKREGYDPDAVIGAMKTDNFNKVCVAFMLKDDDFKVPAPPRISNANIHTGPYSNESDLKLAIDNLSNKMDTTNQLLREIRTAIANAKPTSSTETISRLDKAIGRLNEIENHTVHLAEIKKDIGFTKKATTSIDQRLSGINQVVASARIDLSKVKSLIERWMTGK